MDLLVKGMKMPKSCGKCPMMRPGNYKGQAFPCTCHAKDCFPIKPSELDLRDGLCPLIEVPSADVAEVQHGEWIEKEVFYDENADVISDWQSARCSVCNTYHTTPYSYYFTDYNFCPNCGADMRGGI